VCYSSELMLITSRPVVNNMVCYSSELMLITGSPVVVFVAVTGW